ncbi:MAG: RNA-binding protein Hfq [Paracoccaceae bacterium]|nr:MAG: RNA-binding protein Hfq [Paracoccaceae bacterium]
MWQLKNGVIAIKFTRYISKLCRKSKNPVTLFLVNGVKLQGVITWFDNFSVLLRREGTVQLVYKHAISTIMPSLPLDLIGEDTEEG